MTTVRVGLVQMALKAPTSAPVAEIRDVMNAAHAERVREAASQGVQVICFQEVFNAPYFCLRDLDLAHVAVADEVPGCVERRGAVFEEIGRAHV